MSDHKNIMRAVMAISLGETPTDDLFERCIIRQSGNDWYQINCKLGLWGVTAPDKEAAEIEARRYWIQYYNDGEYLHLKSTP